MTELPPLLPEYLEPVRALFEKPRVKQAMKLLDDGAEAAMVMQCELCEIPAPTFHEEVRAAEDRAPHEGALGLKDVHVDEIGNVIGRRPGRGDGRCSPSARTWTRCSPKARRSRVRREGDRYWAPASPTTAAACAAFLRRSAPSRRRASRPKATSGSSARSARKATATSAAQAPFQRHEPHRRLPRRGQRRHGSSALRRHRQPSLPLHDHGSGRPLLDELLGMPERGPRHVPCGREGRAREGAPKARDYVHDRHDQRAARASTRSPPPVRSTSTCARSTTAILPRSKP